MHIIGIERNRGLARGLISPTPGLRLAAQDVLLTDRATTQGTDEILEHDLGLSALPGSENYFSDLSQEIGLAELSLPPESQRMGKSLADWNFRDEFGLNVIGIRRKRRLIRAGLISTSLLRCWA